MKNRLTFLLLVITMTIFCECKETFIADITSKKITLRAPADSIQLNDSIPTFFWDQLEDANSYRIQIVSPRFDSIERVFSDSIVSNNLFIQKLNRGRQYQWRVKGLNEGSETSYSNVFTLIIR